MPSVDFRVVANTTVPGLSLVYAMNEDAYNYLCDEDITVLPNGAAPLDTQSVGDFISDAGWERYECELV